MSIILVRFLFSACAEPVLLYGMESVCTGDITTASKRELHRAWNSAVRGLVGLRGPSKVIATHALAGVMPLDLLLSFSRIGVCRRLFRSPRLAGRIFRADLLCPSTYSYRLFSDFLHDLGILSHPEGVRLLSDCSLFSLRTRAADNFFSSGGEGGRVGQRRVGALVALQP